MPTRCTCPLRRQQSPPPPLITSFACDTSNNSILSQNESAVLYGTGIYITLPYAVITEQYPLTPTVTLPTGYTIAPTGSYALVNGMQIEVTQTASAELFLYTLHVAADPNTAPPLPPLQLFELQQSQNPSLPADSVGVISGSNIYLALPYSALQAGTSFNVTTNLEPGYTINPSGTYALSDGMSIIVINSTTNAITTYTLHIAVSTGSLP